MTSRADLKGLRYAPMAFTGQGVAMLSSVLRSARAIEVNIAVMRTFMRLRNLMVSHKDLADKILNLENKYEEQFQVFFKAIQALIASEEAEGSAPKRKIGFRVD